MNANTSLSKRAPAAPVLYLALELSRASWKLGFTVGLGQKARVRNVQAGDLARLRKEIAAAKRRFRLPAETPVKSCYEAGRDGFWIHRFLESIGVVNVVVDAASIEVARRKRRAKTDRIDVDLLLGRLVRYDLGERKVWSVVHVPSDETEDERHLHRELEVLTRERTRLVNRIRGLLAGVGVRDVHLDRHFAERLGELKLWDGNPLGSALHCRLLREWERVELLERQIAAIHEERVETLEHSESGEMQQVRSLSGLRGIGIDSAWLLVMEMFGWRGLRNRREVASLAGLAPTPYASGDLQREQGISKAGNYRVRVRAVELAWCWLRYQPRSVLSRWYEKRFGSGGARLRRVGIVALARKLLVALWRFLDQGLIPEGAVFKTA